MMMKATELKELADKVNSMNESDTFINHCKLAAGNGQYKYYSVVKPNKVTRNKLREKGFKVTLYTNGASIEWGGE